MIINGNSVTPEGDICRRLLVAGLDANCETPWRRSFELDPVDFCQTNRLALVAAGLTVLRWARTRPRAYGDRTASFETWSDHVRHAVVEIGRAGFLDTPDPTLSIDENYAADPDSAKLAALLALWSAAHGDVPKTVSDIVGDAERNEDLAAVLDEIAGEHGRVNTRRLGRWIERHSGRIASGLRFERRGSRHNMVQWAARPAEGADTSLVSLSFTPLPRENMGNAECINNRGQDRNSNSLNYFNSDEALI